jgi:hypothetical protein
VASVFVPALLALLLLLPPLAFLPPLTPARMTG